MVTTVLMIFFFTFRSFTSTYSNIPTPNNNNNNNNSQHVYIRFIKEKVKLSSIEWYDNTMKFRSYQIQ